MITNPFVDRFLSFDVDGKEETISHRDILMRSENLIILGEAGMGKSRLLEELESDAVKRISARRFIHAPQSSWPGPNVDCVLIDALDESPAYSDGSVVDQIVAKLEQVSSVRFVLTCRAEEWQAATSRSVISEAFGAPPLECD
jgi:predicted NACHT family NTPase